MSLICRLHRKRKRPVETLHGLEHGVQNKTVQKNTTGVSDSPAPAPTVVFGSFRRSDRFPLSWTSSGEKGHRAAPRVPLPGSSRLTADRSEGRARGLGDRSSRVDTRRSVSHTKEGHAHHECSPQQNKVTSMMGSNRCDKQTKWARREMSSTRPRSMQVGPPVTRSWTRIASFCHRGVLWQSQRL